MKHFVLFFAVFIALFFHANCYSADSSLLSSSSSIQPDGSIDSSGDTSHYLILANGISPSEIPEPQPPKDRPPKKVIEPLEDDEEFLDEEETINDPLEGYNRVVFKFSYKLDLPRTRPLAARGAKHTVTECMDEATSKLEGSLRKAFSGIKERKRKKQAA